MDSHSAIAWLDEASIIAKAGRHLQTSGHLYRECLFRRYAVHSLDGEAKRKISGSGVGMRRIRAVRTCSVVKIPMIRDCRNAARIGLRREMDSLAGLSLGGHPSGHGRGSLGNGGVNDLDYPDRLGRLVLDPHGGARERNRFVLVQHIRGSKCMVSE